MIKWEALCHPRDYGGLGILNTQIMNDCLLVKWIWKIIHNRDAEWCKFLYSKYMKQGNFFPSSNVGGSQFWKGLHKVKHLFKWGAVHKVHNGRSTFFWQDTWILKVPLRVQFPRLFQICDDSDVLVVDCYLEGTWDIGFRRCFGMEVADWNKLSNILDTVILDEQEDLVVWGQEKHGLFTAKSLYRCITFGGLSALEWTSGVASFL